ncbi:MAG: DUF1800 domain-containing protein [Marinibacterium sp.]|nr:DUF1800 domain-containing protein [Marinibacterium sp.]
MGFSPQLAEIRFGCGLSPRQPEPARADDMLAGLTGPDDMAARFPVESFDEFLPRLRADQANRKARAAAVGTDAYPDADATYKAARQDMRLALIGWAGQHMQRRIQTQTAFRERLVDFWTDHLTAYGKAGMIQGSTPAYVDDAIRPHVAGRFEDMLFASATHPVMLHFLDQRASLGPNSPDQQRAVARGRVGVGLNENLAREILELHTLGVDGPYSQADVRQLAELLTGLTFNVRGGFRYRPSMSEPGTEEILGKTYGAHGTGLDTVRAVLTDLARHPATYRHLSHKLAVHFVGDTPDPDLVDALDAAFQDGQGALMPVYEVLLNHPASWATPLGNAKPPFDFVTSSLRALDAPDRLFEDMKRGLFLRSFDRPLRAMGQRWLRPPGPDGFPEDDGNWFTPQGVASRMAWAMSVPQDIRLDLPDPRGFVDVALGPFATEPVRFAAAAAESRPEAIGLVLTSPAFQRR